MADPVSVEDIARNNPLYRDIHGNFEPGLIPGSSNANQAAPPRK